MVSVIVTVYKTEPYLDKCIQSVVNQTYSNIEILLINASSPDSSEEICLRWETLDSRIRYVKRPFESLGASRNHGVEIAQGKYITYVDSDDWLEPDCIEAMITDAETENADMVFSDHFEHNFNTHKVFRHLTFCPHIITTQQEKHWYLLNGHPCAWAKLYRRELWTANHLLTPDTAHEDHGVFAPLIFLSKKIVYTEKCLYNYVKERSGSLQNTPILHADLPTVLDYALTDLKKRNLYHDNKNILARYCKKYIFIHIKHSVEALSAEEYTTLIETPYMNFLNTNFPNWNNAICKYVLAIGGFNLRWILHEALGKDNVNHLCFSSLIPQMQNKETTIVASHPNPFREKAVSRDISGYLQHNLGKATSYSNYFFIDFMEDHYDILLLENGTYCTKSTPFLESNLPSYNVEKVLSFGSPEFIQLWEESCLKLIQLLKDSYPAKHVYLIQNRFSYTYFDGNEEKPYPQKEEIHQLNENLVQMEQFFLNHFKDVTVIDVPAKYICTEANHPYGVEPQYANWSLFHYLAYVLFL